MALISISVIIFLLLKVQSKKEIASEELFPERSMTLHQLLLLKAARKSNNRSLYFICLSHHTSSCDCNVNRRPNWSNISSNRALILTLGVTSGQCFVYSVAEGIMSTVLDLSSPEPQRGSVVEPLLLLAAPYWCCSDVPRPGWGAGQQGDCRALMLVWLKLDLSAAWSKIETVCKHCRFLSFGFFPRRRTGGGMWALLPEQINVSLCPVKSAFWSRGLDLDMRQVCNNETRQWTQTKTEQTQIY